MPDSLFRTALLFSALLLASCATGGNDSPVQERSYTPKEQAVIAEAQAHYSDKTRITWSPEHGTQVAYASPDGRTHLWYPGNQTVLHGAWKVDSDGTLATVCFDYGPNSYNPATGHRGGFECGLFVLARQLTRESANGDIFGLAERKAVPFVMEKPLQYRLDESGSLKPLEQVRDTAAEQAALEEPFRLLIGKTIWSYGVRDGTQLAYLAPDGTAHFWHPGNQQMLHGKWKFEISDSWVEHRETGRSEAIGHLSDNRSSYKPMADICFNYGPNTSKPAAKQSGGQFRCEEYKSAIFGQFDTDDGDIFGLADRQAVPFVMEKPRRYSFDEIREQVGAQ